MLRRDLDVIVVPAAVHFLILDAQIRKVHLIVEVRQVMLERPGPDLFVSPIRVSVVVGAVAVPFVKPRLVVTLELVIEDDSIDACAALCETVCVAFVRPIDLEVVFTLSLAFETVPERLTATLVTVTVMFEKATAFLCERHGMLARAGHSNGHDQALLP
jgi:hypothetical protein